MRTALLILLLSASISIANPADPWIFHCEAEKGERTASVPREPTTLDAFVLELPGYSPDPLDSDATIQRSAVRVLGRFGTHRIIEAQLSLKETYYTDLYILLCEIERGKYLPIYVQQYGRDNRTPELTSFEATNERCSITVVMRYSGTAGSRTNDIITLTEDGKKGIQLRNDRKD